MALEGFACPVGSGSLARSVVLGGFACSVVPGGFACPVGPGSLACPVGSGSLARSVVLGGSGCPVGLGDLVCPEGLAHLEDLVRLGGPVGAAGLWGCPVGLAGPGRSGPARPELRGSRVCPAGRGPSEGLAATGFSAPRRDAGWRAAGSPGPGHRPVVPPGRPAAHRSCGSSRWADLRTAGRAAPWSRRRRDSTPPGWPRSPPRPRSCRPAEPRPFQPHRKASRPWLPETSE
ncbi:hypothetical protein BJY24_003015 [Nocardia transvalensis]|uniref:Uncharacterized protein n=1 Tax=Nocardia transvalensis TaxID=37333 RepID=A0A7W9UI87_9NOCA|nr:hypothetical protein [Nocardia transvalensis]